MKLKKDKMYLIEWLDHTTCYYSWTKIDNVETSDWKCFTAGFFVLESTTSIFLALNKSANNNEYSNMMQILKSTIIKTKELK